MTKNQAQYKKELNRIKRSVKALEKRGFYLNNYAIDDIVGSHPKRITERKINDLKAIRTRNLYKYMIGVDKETGEIVSSKELREKEKRIKAKKISLSYAERNKINIPKETTIDLVENQLKLIKEQFWYQVRAPRINALRDEINILEELFYKNYDKDGYNEFLANNEHVIMSSMDVVVNYEKTIDVAIEKLATLLNYNENLTVDELNLVKDFENEVIGYENI